MTFNLKYTSGAANHNYSFPNASVGRAWFEEASALKSQISAIAEERQKSENQNSDARQDFAPWLDSVAAFHQKWGSAYVPADVIASVHDLQTGLGLPLTVFDN